LSSSTAVIIINLGTPRACTLKAVRRFLATFLMDPYVIQVPWILRALLVYGFIVPFRSRKTLKAYEAIWDETNGSPLLHHSKQLCTKLFQYLQIQYPNEYTVHLAMRYDSADFNLAAIFKKLKKEGIAKCVIVPLYPQYAVSTTYSSVQAALAYSHAAGLKEAKVVQDFYDNKGFIEAQAQIILQVLNTRKIDYVLFSFHSLPQRHIQNAHCQSCMATSSCPAVHPESRWCYRAQCFASARALAKSLGLSSHQYGVSFQSRLGRAAWIGPYTEEKIIELAEQGVRHLAVVCPAFVADCLETQEEINIRLRASWFSLVRKLENISDTSSDTSSDISFNYIPCVNDHAQWVAGLGQIIHNKAMNTN